MMSFGSLRETTLDRTVVGIEFYVNMCYHVNSRSNISVAEDK